MDGTPGRRRGVENLLGVGDDEAMDGTPGRRGVETVLGWGDDDGQLGEREHHIEFSIKIRLGQPKPALVLSCLNCWHGLFFAL